MDIQIPQILFQIFNFGVVVGALTYFLYKPVQKILDERSERVAAAQKAAQDTLKEKEELEVTKTRLLKETQKEAQQLLEKAKEDALKHREQLMAEAKTEAANVLSKAKAGWEREKEKLAAEMKSEFANTVLLVTEKVVGKLDKKTHGKLIDTEIEHILSKV